MSWTSFAFENVPFYILHVAFKNSPGFWYINDLDMYYVAEYNITDRHPPDKCNIGGKYQKMHLLIKLVVALEEMMVVTDYSKFLSIWIPRKKKKRKKLSIYDPSIMC